MRKCWYYDMKWHILWFLWWTQKPILADEFSTNPHYIELFVVNYIWDIDTTKNTIKYLLDMQNEYFDILNAEWLLLRYMVY